MKRILEFGLVVVSLVVIFWPWMLVLASSVYWFFGLPPFLDWSQGRVMFAVIWPFGALLAWLFLVSLFEAFW